MIHEHRKSGRAPASRHGQQLHAAVSSSANSNTGTEREQPLSQPRERKILRITMNHGSGGFFAYVLFAINQIRFAQRNNLVPYVDFGECTVNGLDHFASGGLNRFFDATAGPNMWEYFFEPVSEYRPGMAASVNALPSTRAWQLHHANRDSVFAYPYGTYKHIADVDPRERAAWYSRMRRRAVATLAKYVRLKPAVLQEAERFWRRRIAKGGSGPVLGLHMRGTDKQRDIGGDIVPPSTYFTHIDFCLARHPNTTLFLATDSPKFAKELTARYGSRLVLREAMRSEGNAFLESTTASERYRQGLDVLVDALLLSKCDGLLKPSSAVSEFAVYFAGRALLERTVDLQFGTAHDRLGVPCGLAPRHGTMMPTVASLPSARQHRSPSSKAVGRWASAIRRPHVSVPLRCLSRDYMLEHRALHAERIAEAHGACASGVAAVSKRFSTSDRVALWQRMRDLEAACDAGVPLFRVSLLAAGWLSTLNGALKPLMWALSNGGLLLPPSIREYTAGCEAGDLSCFFEPTTPRSCALRRSQMSSSGIPARPAAGKLSLEAGSPVLTSFSKDAFENRTGVEERFRARGWFWWTAHLLAYLMRPSRSLQETISADPSARELERALASGAVIGLHVRHGDACMRRERARMARTCEPLSAYMPAVHELSRDLNASVVYVATDSEAVIEDTRKYPSFRFIVRPTSRLARGAPAVLWDKRVKTRSSQPADPSNRMAAWEATIELMLLARCDALVGKYTSNLFRNAYALRAASCDCAVPFVSLDATWCFDYGQQSGINEVLAGQRFWC